MKTKNILKLIFACGGIVLLAGLQSCEHQGVDLYRSERFLFFERWKILSESERVRIDTVAYSFSDYIGENEIVHPFLVKLIGDTLPEAAEYQVMVVDTATTALPEQYLLPEHLYFREGRAEDTLNVTVYRKASLKGREVVLTLRLVANENFGNGYAGYRDVRIRFNDLQQKPAWWTEEVEFVYLGTYSLRKLETIAAANPGFTSFEGVNGTERRKIALRTKEYVMQEGITEEDGSPMIIPVR